MYGQILVALDGSELAEGIPPHVEALAEKFGSAVTLPRATTAPGTIIAGTAAGAEPVAGPIVDPTPIIEAEQQEASAYLGSVSDRPRARGLAVHHEHPEGPTADVLLQRARVLGVDLIAMTTHGRGGVGRLVFGSVADAVLRKAPGPVLLVRVSEDANSE